MNDLISTAEMIKVGYMIPLFSLFVFVLIMGTFVYDLITDKD